MIFLDLGRRETGKTTLGYFLIEPSPVRIVFDPRGLLPATARIEDPDSLARAFDRIFETDAGELVITPRRDTNGLFALCAQNVAAYLTSPAPAHVGWLVDELRFLHRPEENEDFDWTLRCVRRSQANIVMTAHRPADVATDIRSITDVWCIFAMTQEHDLSVIESRCGVAVAEQVRRLPPHAFVKWDDARGVAHEYRDSAQWYRPLRHEPDLAERDLNRSDSLTPSDPPSPAGSLFEA